jgi:hypothetical protein
MSLDKKPCDMGEMCLNCQPRGSNGECPDAAPAPDLQREIDARKAAQIENEALKARIARARLDLMDELKKQGWAPAAPAPDTRTPDQIPTIESSLVHAQSIIKEAMQSSGDDICPSLFEQMQIFLELSDEALSAAASPAAPAPATELSDADLQAIHEAWIQTTDGYIALMRQAIAASKGEQA